MKSSLWLFCSTFYARNDTTRATFTRGLVWNPFWFAPPFRRQCRGPASVFCSYLGGEGDEEGKGMRKGRRGWGGEEEDEEGKKAIRREEGDEEGKERSRKERGYFASLIRRFLLSAFARLILSDIKLRSRNIVSYRTPFRGARVKSKKIFPLDLWLRDSCT